MKHLFNFNLFSDKQNREFGLALRVIGVDLSVIFSGYADFWSLFTFRAFGHGCAGVLLQVVCLSVFVGRNGELYE